MRKFTQIKDLSNRRRLPRLGKIRLGIKVETDSGKSYPKETPWFVVPHEVAKAYGTEQPTELDVMIPVEDTAVSFPQAYELYGTGKGLKCTGDGEVAFRLNEQSKAMEQRTCPCEYLEQKKCKQRAHLAVILPKVSMGGIYQIDTSSFNSIIDLNSSIDYVRQLVGRVAMVPLKLKREARETHHDGKKQIHYTLRLEFEGDLAMVNSLLENTTRVLSAPVPVLPPPIQENPEEDDASVEGVIGIPSGPTLATTIDSAKPGDVIILTNQGVIETREKLAADAMNVVFSKEDVRRELADLAPEIEYISLLNKIGLAANADEVNQTLDLSNKLIVAEQKVAIRRAARKRMQELIKK